ncbi:hypothetical protein AHAS_Ahas11G0062600 [Arachis hypogaea]
MIITLLPLIFPQNFISALFSGSTKARHLVSAILARSIRSERDSMSKVLNSAFTSSLRLFRKTKTKTTSLSFSKSSRYSLTEVEEHAEDSVNCLYPESALHRLSSVTCSFLLWRQRRVERRRKKREGEAVLNETLRFSTLLPGLLRIALKDIHFNEYVIPANWIILIFTPSLHMNSEIYKDPLTFNPWRWKELDSLTVSKNFKPFGGGLAQCPGAELSRAFIATFLHVLVTKYRWTKIKGGNVVRNPILGFKDEFHIKIWEHRE